MSDYNYSGNVGQTWEPSPFGTGMPAFRQGGTMGYGGLLPGQSMPQFGGPAPSGMSPSWNSIQALLGGNTTGGGMIGGGGGGGMMGGGDGGMKSMVTLLPEQRQILGAGSDLVTRLLSGQGGYNPFEPLSPAATTQMYNQFFRPAEEAQFTQGVMPQIAESFVGPGTYWSGARAAEESRARADFENQIANRIGQQFLASRQQAQSLLPFASQMAGLDTGVVWGQQGQQPGGTDVMGAFGELLRRLGEMDALGQAQPGATAPAMELPNAGIQNAANAMRTLMTGAGAAQATTAQPTTPDDLYSRMLANLGSFNWGY